MKKIQFRGLTNNGEWVYGYYLLDENRNKHFILNFSCTGSVRENLIIVETLGQFTGLYDKNGKEIYTGDIVKWGGMIGVVVFDEYWGCFGIQDQNAEDWEIEDHETLWGHNGSSTKYSPYLWNYLSKKVEVIGNISKNLDLLKEIK